MARYDRSELQDWRGEGYRWENSDSLYRARWAKRKPDRGIMSSLFMGVVFALVVYLIFFL